MSAMVNSTNTVSPFFNSNTSKLSLEAIGLFLQMSNVPELDYCTKKDLYRSNPAVSARKIDRTIDELIEHNCLIKISDNRLAVNKIIIVQGMQIVNGNLLLKPNANTGLTSVSPTAAKTFMKEVKDSGDVKTSSTFDDLANVSLFGD